MLRDSRIEDWDPVLSDFVGEEDSIMTMSSSSSSMSEELARALRLEVFAGEVLFFGSRALLRSLRANPRLEGISRG
jgi:hypothetical protein